MRVGLRNATLVVLGIGLGMVVTDFGIRWQGWEGEHRFDIFGAVLAWAAVLALAYLRVSSRKNSTSSALNNSVP
jgi:hypothetical protein